MVQEEDLLNLSIEENNDEKIELQLEEEPALEEVFETPQAEYSKAVIANEIGLDKETFEELFHDYIKETRNILNSIETAIQSDDIIKVKKETIKLKGMSDNMRVHSFSDQLDTLMNNSDNQEMSNAVKAINAIINQISK
jgi:HPt (histidine-containing phosphotransfer) domain-containing protein